MKKHTLLSSVFALSLMATTAVNAQTTGTGTDPQKITVTVAGNGIMGYTGDSGPAKKASLNAPNDVCIDAAHNVYFSDQTYTRIRKVTSSTGIVSTIGGGGTSAADGISALDADINVASMCVDAGGNVYFVSTVTNTIRKIDAATDIITTIAGGGTSLAEGIPANTASLVGVNSICTNISGISSDLFVVVGNRVRKINTATGTITTIAGTGTAGYTGDGGPAIAATLNSPMYIAADRAGNVYFGDQSAGVSFSDYVRRIDGATGVITTAFGGGGTLFDCPGPSCMIGGLSGICCDGDSDVIFNEWSCSCRKWHHTSNMVSLVGGNFSMESFANDTSSAYAFMDHNYGICSDEANNYYIADRGNNRIRRVINLTSTPTFAFGEAQSIVYCSALTGPINDMLWATDIDAGQTETWTVVTPPVHGTLGGFPASAISNGLTETTKPTGLTYMPLGAYTGPDAFTVKVSDGVLSNTMTIHVQVMPTAAVDGPSALCVGASVTMAPTIPGGIWSVSNPNATVSPSGVVYGATSGSDNVLYAIDNGCGVMTITTPIVIATLPSAGAISGPGNVCAGSAITLSESVTTGVWSTASSAVTVSPAGVVSGVSAGIAVVSYSVTNACGTNYIGTTISVTPMPDAGTVSGSDEICIQGAATYTTTAPSATGVWTSAYGHVSVTSSGVILGTSVGVDNVIYTVTNACGAANATKTVTVKECKAVSGSSMISDEPSISVYPNPASATLNIHTENIPAGVLHITIVDVTSRVVLRDEMINNATSTKTLDVSNLKEGVYMLTVGNDDTHFVNKIVVSK